MIRGTNAAIADEKRPWGSQPEVQDDNSESLSVSIFANTFSGDAPLTVDFMNQSTAPSLTWDFGDGTSSRENSPSHTFDKPGNYTVKLSAKTSKGIIYDKVNIEVKAISSITDIPNIFTPNSDGENDVFYFNMKNIASIGVAIFSQRTGELIAKWNNLDGNWNGKLKSGADAPEGIYLYSIQAIGTDGVAHSEKGFVTIRPRPTPGELIPGFI
jgi:gliding motility-associated-like protein